MAYVGDKKIWPVSVTIGNLSSVVRMNPTTYSVVMIAVLPEKAKYSAQSDISRQKQATWDHQIVHEVLKVVLQPLFDHSRNCDPNDMYPSPYFPTLCGDGNWHQCFVRIGAWLANYPEHMALQSLHVNSCPWCDVPASKFGDYPSVFPCRDHQIYMHVFYNDDSTQRVVQLTEWGVRITSNNVL